MTLSAHIKNHHRGALIAAVLTVTLPFAASAGDLRIHHIDVEQGDATLVISPDGYALLIDGGNEGKGRDRVVPRLLALGVTRLDATILTHYDADHVGGLDEVIEAGFLPAVAFDHGETNRLTQVVGDYFAAAGAVRRTIQPGEFIQLGAEVTVECVAVNGVSIEGPSIALAAGEENEASVSLVVRYRDFDYFVAGDLTGGGLGTKDVESLIAPMVRDVDVLRVSHHGSPTSTNQALLDRLQPEVAIISVGFSNSYGHPEQGVIDRLAASHGLETIFATNVGNAQVQSPRLVQLGTSNANDGEIVLVADGSLGFSVNQHLYGMRVDRAAPVITAAPAAVDVTGDRATITWTTDEPAEAILEFGLTVNLGSTKMSRALSRTAVIPLEHLASEATYFYRAGAIDGTGNGPTWSAIRSFSTLVAAGGVVINEVASMGSGADEWVELFNSSASAVNLAGWSLTDNDNHTFVFPSFTLPAGAYVLITSATSGVEDNDAADGRALFHAGAAGRFGSTANWNNDGDDVELKDARGVTVDWMAYGTGTGIDAPPARHWESSSYAPRPTSIGSSILRWPNGADHNTLANWRVQASSPAASNGGEPPAPPAPPVAEAGLALFGDEGAPVRFDASGSRSPVAILRYEWSFGDGQTAVGAIVDHVFAESGSYAVSLTVIDANGLSATDGTTVEIANVAPNAVAGGPYSGAVGETIIVKGEGGDVSPGDAAELSYRWTLADGRSAQGKQAAFVFASAGRYTLTLTVSDRDGGEGQSTAEVEIVDPRATLLAISARDHATGTEYGAGSAVVQALRAIDGIGATVSALTARSFVARLAAAPAATEITTANVAVRYRMKNSRWQGALRLELYAGETLIAQTNLPKQTEHETVRWDVTGIVGPAQASGLSLRMVNIDRSGLRSEIDLDYVGLDLLLRR